MAHFFWPNESGVGNILANGGQDLHVVGVVDDVHEESLEDTTGWQIYYPMTQAGPSGAELVVRTTLPPASLAGSVMGALRELNPKQTAAEFRPIKALVSHAVSPRRFFMMLVAAFAALGMLLAALGIYGVISYTVTQQTQEIGVRMALGATPGRVQADVMIRTLRLAATGIVVGAIASFAVPALIASLLFDTKPADPALRLPAWSPCWPR
jgi:ABC-type antimicrobial peptide transport system permease subunit